MYISIKIRLFIILAEFHDTKKDTSQLFCLRQLFFRGVLPVLNFVEFGEYVDGFLEIIEGFLKNEFKYFNIFVKLVLDYVDVLEFVFEE